MPFRLTKTMCAAALALTTWTVALPSLAVEPPHRFREKPTAIGRFWVPSDSRAPSTHPLEESQELSTLLARLTQRKRGVGDLSASKALMQFASHGHSTRQLLDAQDLRPFAQGTGALAVPLWVQGVTGKSPSLQLPGLKAEPGVTGVPVLPELTERTR